MAKAKFERNKPHCNIGTSGQCGLTMVNVTDGTDVYVGLAGIILFLCHWYFLLK